MKIVTAPFSHCHECGKSFDSRFVRREIEAGELVRCTVGFHCAEHGRAVALRRGLIPNLEDARQTCND